MPRRLLAGVAVAVALLVGGTIAQAGPTAGSQHAVVAKSCSSSYTHAVIGGAEKCLRRGQFCAKAYKSQYRKYGFTCRWDGNYWRLT